MAMRLIVEPLADTPENKDTLTYKYVPADHGKHRQAAMREVAIIGVGAHPTGHFTEKPLKEIGPIRRSGARSRMPA